jgi:hypothetical protein
MRKNIVNIFIFFIPAILQAQEYTPSFQNAAPKNNKVSIFTTTGVSMFGGNFARGSSYYMMPSMAYKLSPKLTITSGIGYMHSNISFPGEMNSGIYSSNLFMLHASASYQVNDRLMLYGSVYKTMDNSPQSSVINPRAVNFNSQGTSMGLIYKVSDNIRMGVEFRQRNGSPYMNPYGNPYGYGSPFSGPMFGQPW